MQYMLISDLKQCCIEILYPYEVLEGSNTYMKYYHVCDAFDPNIDFATDPCKQI